MMRISACDFTGQVFKARPQLPNKKLVVNKQITGYTLTSAAALSSLLYGLIQHKETTTDPIKELFETQMAEFPKDIDYRKELAATIGLKEANFYKLRPVIGAEEFKKIVQDFSNNAIHYTPGKTLITDLKDNYTLDGVEAKTFRASMHMHTLHSDGKLSVQELLDKSAEYADKVFDSIKDSKDVKAKNAPFTIAITDHDTLEGNKEAVKIIAANPEKYKNLRVVLGSEMSVENRMLQSKQTSPIPIHMTIHGINPFDLELNQFFDTKKQNRTDLMKDLIKKCSEAVPEMAGEFSFEEAEELYPFLKNKISSVNYPMRDYFKYKITFAECFKNNPILLKELQTAGIKTENITYNSFYRKYANVRAKKDSDYYSRYANALNNYIADLLKITPEEAAKKMPISETAKIHLKNVEKICLSESPKMDLQPAFVDMEEAMEIVKKQPYGYMTWAHPGCTEINSRLKEIDKFEGMATIFKLFKEKGGESALAAEIHYPYFGELGESVDWLNAIEDYAKSNNLYYSGGLGTHGKNIFYSNKQ